MSQFVDGNLKSFQAGAALSAFARVTLTAGVLQAASATDDDLGQLEELTLASGDMVTVRLRTASGTAKMIASGAITAGVRVYQAASGKISATVSGKLVGLALEAATANNDVIEVLRCDLPDTPPTGVAAGYKIARGQLTTVSAADTVVTGLTTVVSVVASYETDPADANDFVSAQIGDQAGTPAAGSIIIKTWKSADGADVTPTAATAFTKKVNWIAIGT